MNSIIFTVLFLCLFTIGIEAGDWGISGHVGIGLGGFSAGLSISWGRKRRSAHDQVFNVLVYMINQKSGSRFRLNPCDFALYDQNGDFAVTLNDFNLIFNDVDNTEHKMVEQLFHELDVDND